MSCVDPYASGIQLYEDRQLGSFTSMPSAQLPDSPGLFSAFCSMAALKKAILCDGQDGGQIPGGGVAEPLDNQYFFTDTQMYDSRMETELYDSSTPLTASLFDSLVSDSSTFATRSSSAEHGEDSTDYMVTIFEGINDKILWQPEPLLPAYHEDNPSGASHCQAHESTRVAIEDYHRHGIFDVEGSLNNIPDSIDAVLSEASRSARTWPCYVRHVCACHRLRSKIDMVKGVAKKERTRKRIRSVEHSKLTYPCEIRISKKLVPKDGKYLKGKAWLGTFATPDQRGRALDVGKYFLSAKKKKTFYDPKSEKILSAWRDRINALPLAERVAKVIKLAKDYGENGLLPQSLNSCD